MEEDGRGPECGTCAHFAAWERQRDPWRAVGDCTRHAPSAMLVDGRPKSVFPITSADRRCGDWEGGEGL